MNVANGLRGLRGEDREGEEILSVERRPAFPKAREGKGFPGGEMNPEGVFVVPFPSAPPPFFHSKNPSAGMRHRRFRNALRKEGFSATVSERALIIRLPIPGSLAQEGIKPQRRSPIRRPRSSAATTGTNWVGAMLNLGSYSNSGGGTPKVSMRLDRGTERVYRPHMDSQRGLSPTQESVARSETTCLFPASDHTDRRHSHLLGEESNIHESDDLGVFKLNPIPLPDRMALE